jgi:hypothetical protein
MAFKWLFFRMSSYMDFKPATPLIFFTTVLALEWLLSSVYQDMCLKMAFGFERFFTSIMITVKWPMPSMGPHVCLEVACFLELQET